MPTDTTAFEDAIVVTTATRSEEEVRASRDGAKAPAAPEPAAAAPVVEPTDVSEGDEAEADGPNAEVSEAARTLRQHRADARRTRLKADNALYEDTVTRLGGTVPVLAPREYATVQAEIDHLSRRRHELLEITNRLLKTPPPARQPDRPAAAPAAAAPAPATAFTFQTWEQYQAEHPDAEYTDYIDARSDARDAFTRQTREAEQQQTAIAQAATDAVAQFTSAVGSFAAEHADYDEVTAKVDLQALGWGADRIAFFKHTVLREAPTSPAALYYLATHPEDLQRLRAQPTAGDFMAVWGEIRQSVRAAGAAASAGAHAAAASPPAAAAPPPPAKPKPGAPAPLAEVRGSATSTRTLQDLAEDGEDADDYIARRKADQRKTR